ncbi:hypothetical protein [Halorientalis marina]|uniref:hypothetical protein n=1 Tax=Halorientalis marina TaxID=2931976 RepID=UPI001FF1714D|nr:hypothetical protein [Halorientalis marina]
MDRERELALAIGVVLLVIVAGTVPVAYPQQKRLPDRPDTLSPSTARTYVSDFERSYQWNQEVDGWFDPVTVNVVRTNVTQHDDGYWVHLEIGFAERAIRSTGGGFYTVNYFVNRTTTMRAVAGGQHRPGLHPQKGTAAA